MGNKISKSEEDYSERDRYISTEDNKHMDNKSSNKIYNQAV